MSVYIVIGVVAVNNAHTHAYAHARQLELEQGTSELAGCLDTGHRTQEQRQHVRCYKRWRRRLHHFIVCLVSGSGTRKRDHWVAGQHGCRRYWFFVQPPAKSRLERKWNQSLASLSLPPSLSLPHDCSRSGGSFSFQPCRRKWQKWNP